MRIKISAPSQLSASIKLPASKSISNRALIIHALSGGNMMPDNLSVCDDTDVVVQALETMPHTINIKAAGTAMRFLTAYLSVREGEHVITGTERMKHRPIGVLVDAMRTLGADIRYVEEEGFPPLHINGKTLWGGQVCIPGDISSQYVSALLLIGPVLKNGLELQLSGNIISRPYIDLTLWLMREFGANADWASGDTIVVKPQPYCQRRFLIENDWSAASYWYEMVALYERDMAKVRLGGLMDASKQGDSCVKHIYSLLGVKTQFSDHEEGKPTLVTITPRMGSVRKIDFDFNNCPDLAQTVVVTCCALDIPFHFKGLTSLKIKETDRIEALKRELRKVGYIVRSANDSELIWDGTKCEPSMEPIDTYEDHRMAMAFAPLAIKFPGLAINNPEVVSKSYPTFWDYLKSAGFTIEEITD